MDRSSRRRFLRGGPALHPWKPADVLLAPDFSTTLRAHPLMPGLLTPEPVASMMGGAERGGMSDGGTRRGPGRSQALHCRG